MPDNKPKREMTVTELIALFLKLAAVVGILAGGGRWVYEMTSLVATKDYHDASMVEFEQKVAEESSVRQKQLNNIEVGTVVQRINGLIAAKCESGTRDLDVILYQQLERYRELAERDFSVGLCADGRNVPDLPVLP